MRAAMLTEAAGAFAYQKIGEEYVATREGAALQWGFSTGKSRVVITRLVGDPRIVYTLFFARLDNVGDMEVELRKHSTLPYVKLTGRNDIVRTVVAEYASRPRNERTQTVFLLNYDKARFLEKELQSLGAEAVVCDESTKIKRWQSEVTKAVCRIGHAPQVVFRAAMAGRMAPQDIQNYWSQFFFVDKGRTLGKDWYWYLNRFFIKLGHDYVPKPGARDEMVRLISENSSILQTSDVRVPKRANRIVKKLEPTARQLSLIAQLRAGAVKLPGGRVWVPRNPAVSFEKELQVCGGYIRWPDPPDHDGSYEAMEDDPKTRALSALLEEELADRREPGEPKVIIWATHHWEISRICELLDKLEWRHVTLHGNNTESQNTLAKDQFLGNDHVRAMVGQADMGVGTNKLVAADTMVWWSNSHKADSRDQAEMRLDRPGQTRNVLNYVDLVLEGQSDHAVAVMVGFLRADATGFTSAAQLLQAARGVSGFPC